MAEKEEKKVGGITEITAVDPKTQKSATVTYDFGENTSDAVGKFGDEVVFSNFVGKSVITVQAIIRRMLRAGNSQDEISEVIKGWKPGVAIERTFDPLSATLKRFEDMTPEEQKKFLADLKAKLKG